MIKKKYYFGEKDKNLNVELIINKPGLTLDIIKKGSIDRKSVV